MKGYFLLKTTLFMTPRTAAFLIKRGDLGGQGPGV